jgi:hypothetical protein
MDEQYNPTPVPPGYYEEKTMAVQGGISLGSLRNPPVRKIVEAQIKELEGQLEERRAFLKDLDNMPGVEVILDRMRKLHI